MTIEAYIGELRLVGFDFAPQGWAFCHGQLLPISSNSALFSLLGTMYGGDGRDTFALPDLQGRVPVGFGQGPGLSDYRIGQTFGTETHTLSANEIPRHNHNITVSSQPGTATSPVGAHLASDAFESAQTYIDGQANDMMAIDAVTYVGGSQSFLVSQPSLVMNWVIATEGTYPPRS